MALKELYRSLARNVAMRREIAFNDLRVREREYNPDGSEKSAQEIAKEAREMVERVGFAKKMG